MPKLNRKVKKIIISGILIFLILNFSIYIKENTNIFFNNSLKAQGIDVNKLIGLNTSGIKKIKGKNVTVVILDSGIEISNNIEMGRIIEFKDFVNGLESPYDDTGHGTLVAEIIGSKSNYVGIAPNVDFIILKVIDECNQTNPKLILESLNWIIDNKDVYDIDILNISLGIEYDSKNNNDELINAMNQIIDEEILVVAASGNSTLNSQSVLFPANVENVIAVGSVNNNETYSIQDDKITSFTNINVLDGKITKPDIFTYGVELGFMNYDDCSFLCSGTGTSYSAPIITGVLCRYIEKYNYNNIKLYKEALMKNCCKLNDSRLKLEYYHYNFIE